MNAHHEMSHEEIARTRLEVLRREHRDLDEAITALTHAQLVTAWNDAKGEQLPSTTLATQ